MYNLDALPWERHPDLTAERIIEVVKMICSVCRELGLHRSYVEKRGRLREIVMRVRRP